MDDEIMEAIRREEARKVEQFHRECERLNWWCGVWFGFQVGVALTAVVMMAAGVPNG